MKNKKSIVKSSHYLPLVSYLSNFSDDKDSSKRMWVYFGRDEVLKNISTNTPKQINPINFCKINYFYETKYLPVNAIEDALKNIEDNYLKVYRTKIEKLLELTDIEKDIVLLFVSTLQARLPVMKGIMSDFSAQILKQTSSLEKQYNNGEKTRQSLEIEELENENALFAMAITNAITLNVWQHSEIQFLTIKFPGDDQYFITTDAPVSLIDLTLMNSIYGIPPASDTVELIVPISPTIAIFINNRGINGYKQIDCNFVREVNNRTLRGNWKYLIAANKVELDHIKLWRDRYTQSFLLGQNDYKQ